MVRTIITATLVLGLGCGTSSITTDGGSDSGADSGVLGVDAGADSGVCVPVTCELSCMHGFTRGADGCEICACNLAPDDSCVDDADCVIARNATGCCGCFEGHSRARVDDEACLVERRTTTPTGCLPDPEICAVVDCAACEPIVRALCSGGECAGSPDCLPGEVPFGLGCVPSCAAHTDCTVAADYSSCCGGCMPAPVAHVDADPCLAERQSESSCSPAPGACDGLGCASPPSDCVVVGESAVCMADGACRNAASDGGCPAGSSDMGGVCVPD